MYVLLVTVSLASIRISNIFAMVDGPHLSTNTFVCFLLSIRIETGLEWCFFAS